MMGSSGLEGDPGVPPRHPPMPPIPLGRTGTHYARTLNRLGWHWWPSDTAVATRDYEGRAACINLGYCTPGCAQGAKASTDITYWPLAIRAGVELRTRCRVREITTDEHGMAAGAIYYDADGREQFQPAEVVILACNGIGTPRLLLNSASSRFHNGFANSSGLVGKNLMLHPWPQVRGYVDEEMDGDRAPVAALTDVCVAHDTWLMTDDALRLFRAVQALEEIGTADARTVLEGIAATGGKPGEEARAALTRLNKK